MTDSDPLIYTRQLYAEKHGCPLYTPEPSSNSPYYLSTGVTIGDVGYVTWDGAFRTLFNILFNETHPRNQIHGVPLDFQPLKVPESAVVAYSAFHSRDDLITRGIVSKKPLQCGISLSDSLTVPPDFGGQELSEGAFLHLPDGGTRWDCKPGPALFRDYAITHAQRWHQFAQEHLFHDNISLYLVTGCDKTNSWALGSYSNPSLNGVELEVTTMQLGEGRPNYDYRCSHDGLLRVRRSQHPEVPTQDVHQPSTPSDLPDESPSHLLPQHLESHCVFVRGYRIVVRKPFKDRPVHKAKAESARSRPKYLEPGLSPSNNSNASGEFASSRLSLPGSIHPSIGSERRATSFIDFDDDSCEETDEPSSDLEGSGDRVIIKQVPDVTEGWHPANKWTELLFSQCPTATVALVHDNDIYELGQQADVSRIPNNTLFVKDGVIYLDLNAGGSTPAKQRLGSPSLDSCAPTANINEEQNTNVSLESPDDQQEIQMKDVDGFVIIGDDGQNVEENNIAEGERHSETMPSRSQGRSTPTPAPPANNSPITSLYVVSGLPKSSHTWTLADPDSIMGLNHSENAVGCWWRPEVLGSTVSPGVGGTVPMKKRGKKAARNSIQGIKGPGAPSKSEIGKMLSKTLKLSFPREVEIVVSTLQPPSTIHTFAFTLPASNTILPSDIHPSMLPSDNSVPPSAFALGMDPYVGPSSTYLDPQSPLSHSATVPPASPGVIEPHPNQKQITYYGCVLTVFCHADGERSAAIRNSLETPASWTRRDSYTRLNQLRTGNKVPNLSRRSTRRNSRGLGRTKRCGITDAETDAETEADGESDFEGVNSFYPEESTPLLPGDTIFWLPYALTLVSRYPVYDLMRDYLTLSWARFSKDVQSHTLQICKILAHPTSRGGDLVRLDASPSSSSAHAPTRPHNHHDSMDSSLRHSNLEVIAHFPGGLDFGRGLIDVNFTMWPLFKCLNVDNILTACEIALAPTGRVLFFSKHPTMLGIAISTLKYLVELRGWSGIALPAVHSRDIKIYIDDPGPWIIGLATEARCAIKPPADVCVIDLDINYLNCQAPPPDAVSVKQQREKYRLKLLSAFDSMQYHHDYSVPSEFKEAFPGGRFRSICTVQTKRGTSSATVADQIKPPDWWNSTKIIQAFDAVLADKCKKPSLFRRIASLNSPKRPPRLTQAEQLIQNSIRRRSTAFIDARDDLETKIGRLSHRLNFLKAESDLRRDKFVVFEQYAEKLSVEAIQLKSKINKEQKEMKRLSGLYTLTAAEKEKLEAQLRDAEAAHKEATVELEHMRQVMEQMEEERAEMVADFEDQLKRALSSMGVYIDLDSEYTGSRPNSRNSSHSATSRRRGNKSRRSRSRGVESTLGESYDAQADESVEGSVRREIETINEEEEDSPDEVLPQKKRFSAIDIYPRQDGMSAMDESISRNSDRIAQKVQEIQRKLEMALTNSRQRNWSNMSHPSISESVEESSSSVCYRSDKNTIPATSPLGRSRSETSSTNQTDDTQTFFTASLGHGLFPHTDHSPIFTQPSIPEGPPSFNNKDLGTSYDSKAVRRAASLKAIRVPKSALVKYLTPESTPTTPALTHNVSGQEDDSDLDTDEDDVTKIPLEQDLVYPQTAPFSAFRDDMRRTASPVLREIRSFPCFVGHARHSGLCHLDVSLEH